MLKLQPRKEGSEEMRIKHQKTGKVHQASPELCLGELTPICPTNAHGSFQETKEAITCKVCFKSTEDQRTLALVAVCELWALKEGLYSTGRWRATLDSLVFRLPLPLPPGPEECLRDALEAKKWRSALEAKGWSI